MLIDLFGHIAGVILCQTPVFQHSTVYKLKELMLSFISNTTNRIICGVLTAWQRLYTIMLSRILSLSISTDR